jgi:hypothetical protein
LLIIYFVIAVTLILALVQHVCTGSPWCCARRARGGGDHTFAPQRPFSVSFSLACRHAYNAHVRDSALSFFFFFFFFFFPHRGLYIWLIKAATMSSWTLSAHTPTPFPNSPPSWRLQAEKAAIAEEKAAIAEEKAAVAASAASLHADKAAIAKEKVALEKANVDAVIVPHGLSADVVERLRRPLTEWQAGDSFDISDVMIVGIPWVKKLFLRAEGLDVLRVWESKGSDGDAHMCVFGSPGIGKSALLQLAALRALFNGDPVLFHHGGANRLLRVVGDKFSIELLADISCLGQTAARVWPRR